MIRWLVGDCRMSMADLPSNSVQAAITSPPFFGLREYGTEPLIWGGDLAHQHDWLLGVTRPITGGKTQKQLTNVGSFTPGSGHSACACGAWRGSLGMEPTPDLFIEHLVEVFRGVRRVLADDGVLFVNMGDSYAGSGKGPTGHNGIGGPGTQERRQGFRSGTARADGSSYADSPRNRDGVGVVPGLKPKDLMMVPSQMAMALRADGWFLRSMIPWLKGSAMPESVTDRPSSSIEYVFLLSKSRVYYWNADAVRVPSTTGDPRRPYTSNGAWELDGRSPDKRLGGQPRSGGDFSNRNRRNGDWLFESLQGMLLDEQGDPLALVVNPTPFAGAHFATWPPKLVEPLVKASSRPGDTILDPFAGSGTTLMVADRLDRHAIGCELSADYTTLGTERVVGDAPLFVQLFEGA